MASALIPLAQGCEELEAVTIIDLLRRAGVAVTTASLDVQTITASRGVKLVADTTLDELLQSTPSPHFDLIALPGGLPGADHLLADTRLRTLLSKQIKAGDYVAAICAAPKVLASLNLLKGKHATAYPGTLEKLDLPDTRISTDSVVVDGQIITSRGPGTAIDFALQLIDILKGISVREEVENGLVR